MDVTSSDLADLATSSATYSNEFERIATSFLANFLAEHN